MVSGFEEYLREKIRQAAQTYSGSKRNIQGLPKRCGKHTSGTSARLLRRIDSSPDFLAPMGQMRASAMRSNFRSVFRAAASEGLVSPLRPTVS